MISVIIPVYKKTEMFLKNLKHNLPYLKDCEIVVVNDDPETDLSASLSEYSDVVLVQNTKNLGFSGAMNEGVKKASGATLLFLNSDVTLNDVSFRRAESYLKEDKDTFAVSFAQKEADGSLVGRNRIYWQDGFLQHTGTDSSKSGLNGWAEGGSCMVRTEMFCELGGFDTLYSPFYWEDVDLSYRAYKRGFNVWFDASIIVTHAHESTIGSFYQKNTINTIAQRNQLLCIWKNVTDHSLRNNHFRKVARLVLSGIVRGDLSFSGVLIRAIIRYMTYRSNVEKHAGGVTDSDIFQKFKQTV